MPRAALVLTAAALAGCSTFNPYRVAPDAGAGTTSPATGQGAGVAFAGGLKEALDQAEAQRVEYLESMAGHARTRNASTAALFGLTAWGLYRAILPDRTPAVDRQVLRLGAAAGATYGIGDFFVNREHEAAYAQGYRAMTCLMVQQRPLLMTLRGKRPFDAESRDDGDFERLQSDISRLRSAIDDLDRHTVRAQIWNGRYPEQTQVREKELSRAVKALESSRRALDEAQKLEQTVRTSGYGLRRRMELIIARVNEELQRTQKDIPQLASTLQGLSNASKAFKGIGSETEAAATGATGSGNPTGDAPPTEKEESTDKPGAGKGGPAARVAAAAPAAASTAARRAKPQPASKTDAAGAAHRIRALEKQLAEIRAKPAMPAWPIDQEPPPDALADKISAVWTARRPVARVLVNFQALTRGVRSVEECRSGAAVTSGIVPDADISAARDKSYDFAITSTGGVPQVTLLGDPGTVEPPQRPLETTLNGTTIVARVRVGKDAPAGTLRLVVTDAAHRSTEDVVLTIPAPDKPASTPADTKP